MHKSYARTPDGRYFVVQRRLWRYTSPALDDEERTSLAAALMGGRRPVGAALKQEDEAALATARCGWARSALDRESD